MNAINRAGELLGDLNRTNSRNEAMIIGLSMMAGDAAVTIPINGFKTPPTDSKAMTAEARQDAPSNLAYGIEGGSGAVAGLIVAVSLLRRARRGLNSGVRLSMVEGLDELSA